MGQAKQRGSKEQRVAKATQWVEEIKPKSITCNHCKSEILDIHAMNSRSIPGIEAAFAGICSNCNQTTWAVKGDPEVVSATFDLLAQESGSNGKLGLHGRNNVNPPETGLYISTKEHGRRFIVENVHTVDGEDDFFLVNIAEASGKSEFGYELTPDEWIEFVIEHGLRKAE